MMFDDLPFFEFKHRLAPVDHLPPRCGKKIRCRPLTRPITIAGSDPAKLHLQFSRGTKEHFPHRRYPRTFQVAKHRIIEEDVRMISLHHPFPVPLLEVRIKSLYQPFFVTHKKILSD